MLRCDPGGGHAGPPRQAGRSESTAAAAICAPTWARPGKRVWRPLGSAQQALGGMSARPPGFDEGRSRRAEPPRAGASQALQPLRPRPQPDAASCEQPSPRETPKGAGPRISPANEHGHLPLAVRLTGSVLHPFCRQPLRLVARRARNPGPGRSPTFKRRGLVESPPWGRRRREPVVWTAQLSSLNQLDRSDGIPKPSQPVAAAASAKRSVRAQGS
jgi:hypothetical protein